MAFHRPVPLRLALVAFLVLGSTLPLAAQTPTQPDGAISIESDLQLDAAILERIRGILRQLDRYAEVRVSVVDGVVTLRGTVLEPELVGALNTLVARVDGVVAIENRVVESTDLRERLSPAIGRMQMRMEQVLSLAPLILVAVGAGLLTILLGFLLASRSWPWDRLAPNSFIAEIYRQFVRLAFILAGIILTLDVLSLTALLSTLLGAAGIVGLAIGFAVRDSVENFISSIMLSIRQPFRPKDLVEIEGELGHVIRLTSRATILLSPDGNHIRIPNATVFKAKIINYTRNDERRFTFTLGVATHADIAEAQDIILAALVELPFVLDQPAPGVWVEGIGPSTIDITGAGWIKQHETDLGMAKGEAIRVAKARLEAAGITLPEPGYRLIGAGLTGETPDAAHAPATGRPVTVKDVSATDTPALHQIIEAEREALPEDDLLRQSARQE